MEIIITADGSDTLFVPEINEHYHSTLGAVQESDFIFIKNGLGFCTADPVRIFEVGFGTGLNALLSAVYSLKNDRRVYYTSIEKDPLPEYIIKQLNYPEFVDEDGQELFRSIHSCNWNIRQKIHLNFFLEKIDADLLGWDPEGEYDLIYFDAFCPDKQPELWTRDIFTKIEQITVRGGILVSYSVKGEVKRVLRQNGFRVNRLPGPPGKRHILRAIKI
ncbi:MAG: tRNA (5-methylaminomethyl-2-thiouridine)(34)-methyltransferase MnmD [Bacteroidota bacterium]|nr:tRNA (5-methylaminomethyl-2-thiouridine)(34)-methyltransferase MnmD [Bacteroidota bacterium]